MRASFISAMAVCLLPAVAWATPQRVDLSGWIENSFQGAFGAGNWTVQGPDNDTVFQSLNGDPTVFFDAGTNAQGTTLSGQITVGDTTDDDFIGFVLGYQDGEFNSSNADFWLIDWKLRAQSNVQLGDSSAGLALSHVTGDMSNTSAGDFWAHSGTVNEVQRATSLGSISWVRNRTYTFDLTFTSTLIEVSVDGTKQISFAGNFTDGAFGFYNYSQENVTYAGITSAPAPIPLPAGLPLLLAGLGGLALVRRRAG
jgi:hypothetical protein